MTVVMLVKYVGEKFSVCWWKVRSRKNISFQQHAFFTNILHQHKNSHKITYTTYELHQKNTSNFIFPTKISVVYDLRGINNTVVLNYTILAIILSKWHVIGSIWLPEMIPRIILPSIRHKQHHFRFPFPRIFQVQLPV